MMKILDKENTPLTIVLVEDDDADAKAIKRAFTKARLENDLFRVENGIAALELLRGHGERPPLPKPYLLLIDLNMPRMNGFDLIRALRNDHQLRATVAFVLTTSNNPYDIESAYDLNVAGYIKKETASQDLTALIDLLKNYWHAMERPV